MIWFRTSKVDKWTGGQRFWGENKKAPEGANPPELDKDIDQELIRHRADD